MLGFTAKAILKKIPRILTKEKVDMISLFRFAFRLKTDILLLENHIK